MSSKYRGAFLNILTCNSNNRKASNGSLFRTTVNICSDAGHAEKEPSLRISKQSFEADSSMLEKHFKSPNNSYTRNNHLSVPEKNTATDLAKDEHYRNKKDVNNMSFIRISPDGKLDDVMEIDDSVDSVEMSACEIVPKNHNFNNFKGPKKDLVVNASGRMNYMENSAGFKSGKSSGAGREIDYESSV